MKVKTVRLPQEMASLPSDKIREILAEALGLREDPWARLAQALFPTPEGVETGMRAYGPGFPDAARAAMEAVLTDRERAVVESRYGLGDGKPRTQAEVGRALGLSRERIRQIEAKAIRKLRRPGLGLAGYVEEKD